MHGITRYQDILIEFRWTILICKVRQYLVSTATVSVRVLDHKRRNDEFPAIRGRTKTHLPPKCTKSDDIDISVRCVEKYSNYSFISNLSDDRSTASSKTIPPLNDLELPPSNESILFCPQGHPAVSYVFFLVFLSPFIFPSITSFRKQLCDQWGQKTAKTVEIFVKMLSKKKKKMSDCTGCNKSYEYRVYNDPQLKMVCLLWKENETPTRIVRSSTHDVSFGVPNVLLRTLASQYCTVWWGGGALVVAIAQISRNSKTLPCVCVMCCRHFEGQIWAHGVCPTFRCVRWKSGTNTTNRHDLYENTGTVFTGFSEQNRERYHTKVFCTSKQHISVNNAAISKSHLPKFIQSRNL
jgi:hypothetical protein